MERIKAIRRIWLILFSIAVMLTGMYIPNGVIDSCFSYPNSIHTMSAVSGYDKKMDAIDEKSGIVSNEIRTKLSSGIRNILLTRNNSKDLFSSAVLPFIPLILWAIINVLLRNEFIDRLYLILFIHNSDGKKGDRASILMP